MVIAITKIIQKRVIYYVCLMNKTFAVNVQISSSAK